MSAPAPIRPIYHWILPTLTQFSPYLSLLPPATAMTQVQIIFISHMEMTCLSSQKLIWPGDWYSPTSSTTLKSSMIFHSLQKHTSTWTARVPGLLCLISYHAPYPSPLPKAQWSFFSPPPEPPSIWYRARVSPPVFLTRKAFPTCAQSELSALHPHWTAIPLWNIHHSNVTPVWLFNEYLIFKRTVPKGDKDWQSWEKGCKLL